MIRFLFLTLIIFISVIQTAQAQEKTDLLAWGSLPILHEGRVKPLDSFARVTLKKFSNHEYIEDLSATEWLAESVFTPGIAIERPVFKIRHSNRYGLKDRKDKLYSYADLAGVIDNRKDSIQKLIKTPEEDWSSGQTDLMILYQNFILHTQILRSLTLILPFGLQDHKTPKDFLDYKNLKKTLDQKTKKIVRRKGSNLEKYTEEEKEITLLSYQLNLLEEGGKNNILFRIIPLDWDDKNTEWVSPWELHRLKTIPPKSLEYIEKWKDMANAYRKQNIENKHAVVTDITFPVSKTKLYIEKTYNLLHLLKTALILYGVSLICLVLFNLNQKNIFKDFALLSLITGFIAHTIHIALRIYILERPPVGTLYESILFVSFSCIAGFIFLACKQKNTMGILLGSLSGVILLTTAQGFSSDDTMSNLVAVLNTNFWLTTHVLCITVGYSCCFIASLMAHYALITKYLKQDDWSNLFGNIKTLIILSLLFTTIGTILGGIWADQSWGRFWGWDPKENGALLIILWIAWLLHSRISNHINETNFVTGTALLSIIVVLAWFGVNLLNVGLHSYGFISGVAWGIGAFCAFEILIIGGIWFGLRQKGLT